MALRAGGSSSDSEGDAVDSVLKSMICAMRIPNEFLHLIYFAAIANTDDGPCQERDHFREEPLDLFRKPETVVKSLNGKINILSLPQPNLIIQVAHFHPIKKDKTRLDKFNMDD
ncbi:hypothetical protein AVEN_22959-1 [Araneus ventricosus]|uniref:Uncharacterized protein n=1 Tax=Araneus ventricosus TaxID=182803 RepID=A0A4Y2PCQ9_ARAVE|nr:hypothetical protein AVEN_22959-1 [Araneus ventricosus]